MGVMYVCVCARVCTCDSVYEYLVFGKADEDLKKYPTSECSEIVPLCDYFLARTFTCQSIRDL